MSGSSFCFLHAADLHLDTPFVGINKVAPAVAEALRDASLRTFDAIVELALERDAAFFLAAGDIYDGAERGLRAQLRFHDGLRRMVAGGISCFVVHGNHDPLTKGWSAIERWPEGVTVFGHGSDPAVVELQRGGQRLATVQGISYATAVTTENLALRLRRPPGEGLHVGVLHCNVEGFGQEHSNYSPCTLSDLRATGLDYLALGHVHEHRVLSGGASGEPWVVYPGNSQARSFRRSEIGAKGAVVAHVEEGAVVAVEHVACDQVRFTELSCDVSALQDLPALEDRLLDEARSALGAAGGRPVVGRARLVGRGRLHAQLARPGVAEDLLASLRDQGEAAGPFFWWDSLMDETSASIDRAALRGRGDFAGDLVELADTLLAGEGSALELLRAVGAPPRAMRGAFEEALADETALRQLIEGAADLALEALGEQR